MPPVTGPPVTEGLLALPVDDLGTPVPVAPARIVSLVPNLSEALWWWGLRERVVAVTDFCVSPPDGFAHAARVRGTKNPDVRAIAELRPDLVVVNVDENRALDVERLRERGVAVYVTAPTDLDGAAASLRRLGAALGVGAPALATADAIRRAAARARVPAVPRDVLVPIWRDPWMAVGTGTVAGSLLAAAGLRVVPDDPRYPRVDLGELAAPDRAPDLLLLPDEPWAFGPADAAELRARFPGAAVRLFDGAALTWWGPRTPAALRSLVALRRHLDRREARRDAA